MRRGRALLSVLAGPALIAAGTAGPPSAQTIIAMTPSVVRVVSAGCGAERLEHVGTGFIWPNPGDVVTDLHLLVGCSGPISVTFWVGNEKSAPLPASVVHVLIPRDLVLLHVAHAPPEARPLSIDVTPPQPDDEVKVYGYPRGIAAPEDKRLAVSVQTETFPQLSSSLDGEARDQLVQLSFPRLDTEVVHLDGALSPGHSGAPVINGSGGVVGVGSGGLQQGAAGISWAVRTEYLQELLTQGAALPAAPSPTGPLYAMLEAPARSGTGAATVAPEPDIPSVTCGELTLTRQGTATLAQLIGSAVDRADIQRIASQELHIDVRTIGAQRAEIWSEPGSGAAVVVPEGARLVETASGAGVPGGTYCVTEHPNHPLIYNVVHTYRLPGHITSPEWEFEEVTDKWMELGLMSRLAGAGLVLGRPGARRWNLNAVINGAWVLRRLFESKPMPDAGNDHPAVVLRSDMAGRGAFVMVAALARMALDKMQPAEHEAWAADVLSVYLSTFPPRAETTRAAVVTGDTAGATEADPTAVSDELSQLDAEMPADFSTLRTYPRLQCGWGSMWRLSGVTSVERALIAADNPKDLTEAVTRVSGLRPSDLAATEFDQWGQAQAGLGLFFPRGMDITLAPQPKLSGPRPTVGAGRICQAIHPAFPDLRLVVFSFGNRNLHDSQDLIRHGLEAAIGGQLVDGAPAGPLRSFTASTADGHSVRAWLAEAGRNQVVSAMALLERDPRPPGEQTKQHAAALAADLIALRLSQNVPDLSATQ